MKTERPINDISEAVLGRVRRSKSRRRIPINGADIMPQYPAGIKALLDFLKKNLQAAGRY